jgi:endo-1,3(4)-beta-glucanase
VTAVTSFLYILLPAYNVNVNMMGASLVRNIPFKVITHPDPPNSLWGVVTKPYPTGAFWTNLVIKNGDYPVGVLPYGVKCLETGIQISYGAWRRYVTQLYIQDAFGADLQISSYQPYLGRAVDSYDNFSVGMTYRVAGGKYKAQLVRGSPFITVLYDNATPVISSMVAKIVSLEFRAAKVASGVQYIVTLSNYQKWLIYCSETAPLAIKDNTITSPYPIKGFLRVAFLPLQNPDAAFVTLMTYVQRYPVGAAVSMAFPASNIVQLTYQFASVGTGPLLMLSLPHHNQVMIAPIDSEETRRIQASVSPLYCLKGKMKAIVGDVWKLQYNLPQVRYP